MRFVLLASALGFFGLHRVPIRELVLETELLVDHASIAPSEILLNIDNVYITPVFLPNNQLPSAHNSPATMSTSAAGGSGGPDEERKGLSKFVRRASKVFRRRSSTPASASGSSDPTQPASGTGPIKSTGPQVSSPRPIAETAIEEQPSIPPPVPITTQQPIEQKTTPGNARVAKTAAASITIHEERARTLFVKYGLTLEPGEWTSPIKPDAERVEKKIPLLTVSSHTKDKYPEGYPGDSDYNAALRERHDIRVHVRWTCHLCSKTFKDLSRKCEGCQHERCDDCPRHPPKREKRRLDPDALARIEGRMKEDLSPQGASAA
ncbi:MAG: hypothetical protein L6R37_001971 [Teloschistes peruensis]|nr:MAG: hypothetical protein L6R37_001971 [Teloschistes peruensis]